MEYSANTIKIYKDLEAVMIRPGMYIGDLTTAVKQMLYEILDNSIDELVCGHGSHIEVIIDGHTFTVKDNGRGIPVDIHPTEGISAVELILTKLHAGGKFGNDNYKFSGGLHGVGASVVNALSDSFECTVFKNNKMYHIGFERGKVVSPLKESDTDRTETGTIIKYTPNFQIVDRYEIPADELKDRLQELVYLNPNINITLDYHGKHSFKASGGVLDFLNIFGKINYYIYDKKEFTIDDSIVAYEIAIGWTDKYQCNNLNFCNNIKQSQGGTHFTALKHGLFKAIDKYIETFVKSSTTIHMDDIFIGLQSIVSVKIPEPQFSSQTKEKLISKLGKSIVDDFIKNNIDKFLDSNPQAAKEIIKRIIENAKIRENSQKERNVLEKIEEEHGYRLYGKLSDCQSNDITKNELFIVEGDSAGGSAKLARDRKYQAILPIRGKLLNVERSTIDKIKSFKELYFLIGSIGTGILKKFDITKLRYGKIILMPDADIDGRHIASLLLTAFIKLMPGLIENGHVYISRPPLYKIQINRKNIYVNNEQDLEDLMIKHFKDKHNIEGDLLNVLNQTHELLEQIIKLQNKEEFYHIKHIPDRLLMFYMVFKDDFLDKMKQSGYNTELRDNKLYIKDNYYNKYYIWENIPFIENNLRDIAISIDGVPCYDMIKLKDMVLKHDIKLQRYKGLGEMNASELKESCIKPENRRIEQITLGEDSLDIVSEIMGDENRRDFILSNITRLFNL